MLEGMTSVVTPSATAYPGLPPVMASNAGCRAGKVKAVEPRPVTVTVPVGAVTGTYVGSLKLSFAEFETSTVSVARPAGAEILVLLVEADG